MRKELLGALALLTVLLSIRGSAAGQTQFIPRPTPMGVAGGNSGFNTESVYPECLAYGGTLGALLQDAAGTQYILSDAHVLALGPTGYYASGSNVPIVQPFQGDAYPTFLSCPPTPIQIAAITVGTLSTVLPLNLNGVSSQDAALARAFTGSVVPQQYRLAAAGTILSTRVC